LGELIFRYEGTLDRHAGECVMIPFKKPTHTFVIPRRAAPAVSRAKLCKEAHTSIQVQRKQSGLACAMVLTVYFVISPAIGISCHRRWRLDDLACPVGLERPPPT
jgi:hypothetical protein